MTDHLDTTIKPWYREAWPWYLMSGPFFVVVASLATAWVAYSTSDGLVTEDYYQEGLLVNETLARSQRAVDLGLEVRARFTAEGVDVGLASATDSQFVPPAALRLNLSHPTRAGLDQSVMLRSLGGNRYAGDIRLPASGHWLVLIEDDAKTWRLMGSVLLPALGDTVIGGPEAADVRNH